MTGTIVKAISGFYYVSGEDALYECKARGSFRNSETSPLVGDRVEFSVSETNCGRIEKVLPRKNALSRPPIANVDKLFIVSSFSNPPPNPYLIDKLSAIAVYHHIEPVIVFNKSDCGDFHSLESVYSAAGFSTYTLSAKTGAGIAELKKALANSVSAFTGNSGVGKSSILNSLFGDLQLKTGEISEKLGRGRHTTRHTELFALPENAFVADTPGFSSLDSHDRDFTFKSNLIRFFPDFDAYSDGCRFSSCTHTCEKGCAVIKAIREEKAASSRHNSYCRLLEEMKDVTAWNTGRKNP